ncbi:MAG: NAD(P)-dependent oxidoreductase, partial [Candidatus Puniceispirillaceae bacterium]
MTGNSVSKVAVFGLGSMGYGMAQSLLRAGHTVYGFDVVPEAVARFVAEGGAEGGLADIAPDLDAVVVVVLNAEQTESVLFGESGVVPMLRSGAVVVSCATVPPEFARDMATACEARQVRYLDAPISGGSVKAAAGQLSIMASGSQASFDAAAP